jgi:hypothetical protein
MMMTIAGLDYAKVSSNAAVQKSIIDGIKAKAVAALNGISTEDVVVTLSSGSVKAAVTITPVPGSTSENLKTAMTAAKTTLAAQILTDVKAMPDVASVMETGKTPSQLTITAEAPVVGSGPTATTSKAFSSQGTAVVSFMVVLLAQLLM